MRDPKRIECVLNTVREVWEKVPDYRLGQLLAVAAESPDLFSIEDTDLQHRLAKLSEQISRGERR